MLIYNCLIHNLLCLLKNLNQPTLTSKYLEEAATLYGTNGDLNKYAEFLSKAAVEMEPANEAKAVQLYEKG